MSENRYDVIVVGARCAGSPTAMLLARRATGSWSWTGRRSPATPSPPTSSTPRAWPRCGAGACSSGSSPPGAHRSTPTAFDFGPFTICRLPRDRRLPGRLQPAADGAGQAARRRGGRGGSRGAGGVHRLRACRRRRSGDRDARARQGRGRTVTERARVVIGADGVHSLVARPCGPSSTTTSRGCSAATTPTTAGCRWTAATRSTSARPGRSRRGPPTTT